MQPYIYITWPHVAILHHLINYNSDNEAAFLALTPSAHITQFWTKSYTTRQIAVCMAVI